MPYCPNCGDEIAADISSCPTCEALFGPGSAWHPLIEPPAHRDLQSIAEFRAATERRRQKREREARAPVEQPVKGTMDTIGKRLLTVFVLVLGVAIIDVLIYRGTALMLIFIKPIGALFLLPYGLLHFADIQPERSPKLAVLVSVVYLVMISAYLIAKNRKVATAMLVVVVVLFVLNLHGCEQMIANWRWGGR